MTRATTLRRDAQRTALLDAAERRIADAGLTALKARDLASEVGCAVGALYTLVADMDEVVLRVGSRTLGRLDAALTASAASAAAGTPAARLVAIARTYADFAADNLHLWRALFEFRLADGRALPDWSAEEQIRLFRHIDAPLSALRPDLPDAERHLLARTLFSAVHGIVVLGLEGKLIAVPRAGLHGQIAMVVEAIAHGLAAGQGSGNGNR
ncbi:TetR/AcrR family transcriptional regulator [Methylobrevis pamukkalensis]|uniref:HTH-type transcriptional regulator MT1864/Rv1816-like C-terminal domain-containing protein n=1 Tax=Methylobrevis pamukkalensis TaxID=1439726 RepID=A0A1E3GXC1_9HYPH|nr:TetR/AcrR family transcriptional regulator [Methylobrevis pamukkalensis]ODN68707.1 hypothetical protein A6302_03990 [Methylobrevis pamukkalensis]